MRALREKALADQCRFLEGQALRVMVERYPEVRAAVERDPVMRGRIKRVLRQETEAAVYGMVRSL